MKKFIKKIFICLMILTVVFGIVGCKGKDKDEPKTQKAKVTQNQKHKKAQKYNKTNILFHDGT